MVPLSQDSICGSWDSNPVGVSCVPAAPSGCEPWVSSESSSPERAFASSADGSATGVSSRAPQISPFSRSQLSGRGRWRRSARALLRLRERFEGGRWGLRRPSSWAPTRTCRAISSTLTRPRGLSPSSPSRGSMSRSWLGRSNGSLAAPRRAADVPRFCGECSEPTRASLAMRRRSCARWLGFVFSRRVKLIGRAVGGIAALAMAMAAGLCVRPDQGLTAGFQLSYGAVLAFLFFLRPVDAAFARFLPRRGPARRPGCFVGYGFRWR